MCDYCGCVEAWENSEAERSIQGGADRACVAMKGKIEKIRCDKCGEFREWIGYQCISSCSCMLTDNAWEDYQEEDQAEYEKKHDTGGE